ncbi:MAG: DNA polymerase Y family protein [Pseudomonadota bacterium]|nr:DNA polymerase Y family protein [Pseudomonadota bacterium]
MTLRWLYLLFPDLYLHNLMADAAHDAARPLALLPAGNSQHISQCNAAAHQAGVEADMPLSAALCLCPELQAVRTDPHQLHRLLQARALWAGQFSAFVSPDPPQGLWLEIASMLRLFGGWEPLQQRLQQSAGTEGPVMLSGAGATPLAARLRACCGLPPGSDQHDLQPLSLAQLQQGRLLDDEQVLTLQRLGVRTLADILRLPQSGLASRCGLSLQRDLSRLCGHQAHPLPAFEAPLTFVQRAQFIHEVEHANGLLFPLQRLLGRLSDFLQRRQLSTRLLQLTLSHRRRPDSEWQIRFAHGEYRQPELVFLCRHFLEQQRLPAPVQTLTLTVEEFVSRGEKQHTLLASPPSAAGDDHHQLLNRLGTRLQPQQLLRLSAIPDPRPEQSARLDIQQAQTSLPSQQRTDMAQRPLWLLAQPQPCPPPQQVVSGPERICSGWWDEQPVRRDYYVVLSGRRLLWVFHAPQGWFIHGLFS